MNLQTQLVLVTGAAGWLTYQEIGGELFEELHEGLASTMLAVVVVHLVGVAVGSLVHRENLPRTMITGRKIGATRDAIIGARPLAAMVLLGWVGALAWLLSR